MLAAQLSDTSLVLCTVKPLMLTYPLFPEFCEPNKTVKLKGANIDYIATLIDNLGVDKW